MSTFKYKVGNTLLRGNKDEFTITRTYIENGKVWFSLKFIDGSVGDFLEKDIDRMMVY